MKIVKREWFCLWFTQAWQMRELKRYKTHTRYNEATTRDPVFAINKVKKERKKRKQGRREKKQQRVKKRRRYREVRGVKRERERVKKSVV